MRKPVNVYHPKNVVKVIGVGRGGCNAVDYMARKGLDNVSFALCHNYTDLYNDSPVRTQIKLGFRYDGHQAEGFKKDAEEKETEIRSILNDGTKVSLIVAGMGGGIGNGAAPVIARISKESGLLTIGIATLPFRTEGQTRLYKAIAGVEELAKHVDTIVIINSESMHKMYPETSFIHMFSKVDETLRLMVRYLADLINDHEKGKLGIDDLNALLREGGVGLITHGHGKGYGGVTTAIQNAMQSPLIYSKGVFKAKKILLNVNIGNKYYAKGLTKADSKYISDFKANHHGDCEILLSINRDTRIVRRVDVTLVATGYDIKDIDELKVFRPGKYEMEPMSMDQITELEEKLRDSTELDVIYPWEHVCDSIKKFPEKVGLSSAKCPVCGHNIVEIYFSSPEWTWESLCGRAGNMFICPNCRSQKHFELTMLN